jgi:hypothetical protein
LIERVVFLKMQAAAATPEALKEIASHSREVLSRLPGVRHVHVGTPADQSTAQDWDIALVLHLDSKDDLEPYRVHPDHRSYVDEYLKPRLQSIKAWSFEVPEP